MVDHIELGVLAKELARGADERLPEGCKVFFLVCHVDDEIPSTNGQSIADVRVGTNTNIPIEFLLPLLENAVQRAYSILGDRQPVRFFDGNGADA